ncbi:uncharacterized protein VTP21DRAFT_10812 [Calcarisporiella thermophila]|uniref:uncharacterized protein n=1 Tax=Calcarisporiella thermophila TaxID=911321 RepID=UPI0037433AAC
MAANKNFEAVSIIGLGDMGVVLAQTLLRSGYRVTVWNRSSSKAEPVVREGGILAPSVAAAISSSPISIICVTDYKATRSLLDSSEVIPTLKGRLLVELSTGTPQDARDAEAWVRGHGADYLDGAILATPVQIGRPDTPIFVSGNEFIFKKAEPLLKVLAGNLQFMGEAIGAASTWDLGFLSYLWGSMFGFLHGARIFESEGIRVDALGAMIANLAPIIGEMVKHESNVIQEADYSKPQSSVKISSASIDLIKKQAQEAKINSEVPTFIQGIFKKALAAGYGDEEVGAVIKVLRDDA